VTTALDHPVLRAARRVALVVGAGALGAAVCSAGVRMTGPGSEQDLPLQLAGAALSSPRTLGPAEERALGLLRRASTAERTLSYSGLKYLSGHSSSGATAVVLEVRHRAGVGTWLRTSGAGEPAEERVAPGGPAGLLVGEESRPDLEPGALGTLTRRYTLSTAGTVACAGRWSTVVEAHDLATRRLAARFWVDDASGLLLRRELYDEERRTVRTTAFVQLVVGAAAVPPGAEPSPVPGPPGGRLVGATELERLRGAGWHLPAVLPGGLELHTARRMTMGSRTVLHLAYSDGLFSASVFAERGRLDAARLHGFRAERLAGTQAWTRSGLTRSTVWAGGGTVWTLVTDAPDRRVERVLAAMPRAAAEDDTLARVGRGIGRVGSWANPFD